MHVAIVGNGIAGITAARTIRKLQPGWRITVISSETEHFFSRTALMYIYMGHLTFEDTKPYEDLFWDKSKIDLLRGHVERVDHDAGSLAMDDGKHVPYDRLILATGSVNNMVGWPGQDLPGVQGLVSLPDVELLEKNSDGIERAIIVGGGLIGMEMAEMLRSRKIEVTFLVREQAYMDYIFPAEESELIRVQFENHHVDLRLGTELAEILPGPEGRVGSVRTSDGEEIDCQLVGLTAGVRPNIALAEKSGIDTGRGILVDRQFRTSVPNVFSAGDSAEMRDPPRGAKSIEPLWYRAREQGETAGRNVADSETEYSPTLFFNSAKCFDLEYQTYGAVAATLPDDEETAFWWDERERLVRVNYKKDGGAVVGFNGLGIRLRQDICTRWILEGRPIDEVRAAFREAVFDPEFSRSYGKDIQL